MTRSGAKLRAVRKSLGMRPEEAALKAGLSASYLLNLELGHTPITDAAVMKLARGWGIAVDDLERRLNGGARKSA